jgi:uncharacterized protein YycO
MFEKIRRVVLDTLQPVVKDLAHTHMPYTHKMVNGLDYFAVQPLVKPGMIWLTRMEGEATNLFIPGFWTHAAIAVDDKAVIQATSSGVVATDLISFLLTKDYVGLFDPLFGDATEHAFAAAWAAKQIGAPYDYEFGMDVKAFYCSELVWAAYREAMGPDNAPFKLRQTLGVDTVIPDDIGQAKDKFKSVWRSLSCDSVATERQSA